MDAALFDDTPPPLPSESPPPLPHAEPTDNPASEYDAASTASGWQYEPVPHISMLLYREAEAWRTLSQLHQGVAGVAQSLTRSMDEFADRIDLTRDDSEAREAAYCASLSSLATQCDLLSTEALRLRALRKNRASVESRVIRLALYTHSNETVSEGEAVSGRVSTSITELIHDLKRRGTGTRTEIAQLRTAIDLLNEASPPPPPPCTSTRPPLPPEEGDDALVPTRKPPIRRTSA